MEILSWKERHDKAIEQYSQIQVILGEYEATMSKIIGKK